MPPLLSSSCSHQKWALFPVLSHFGFHSWWLACRVFCYPKFVIVLSEDANQVREMPRTEGSVSKKYNVHISLLFGSFVLLCWPLSNLISFRLPQNTSNREETETCGTQRRYSKQSQSIVSMLLLKTEQKNWKKVWSTVPAPEVILGR